MKSLIPKYEAIGASYMEILKEFTDEELDLICHYLEKASEVSKQELAKFVAG